MAQTISYILYPIMFLFGVLLAMCISSEQQSSEGKEYYTDALFRNYYYEVKLEEHCEVNMAWIEYDMEEQLWTGWILGENLDEEATAKKANLLFLELKKRADYLVENL